MHVLHTLSRIYSFGATEGASRARHNVYYIYAIIINLTYQSAHERPPLLWRSHRGHTCNFRSLAGSHWLCTAGSRSVPYFDRISHCMRYANNRAFWGWVRRRERERMLLAKDKYICRMRKKSVICV